MSRRLMLRNATRTKNGFVDGTYSTDANQAVVSNGNHILYSTPTDHRSITIPFITPIQIHNGDVVGISFSQQPYLDDWTWSDVDLFGGSTLSIYDNGRKRRANTIYTATSTSDLVAETIIFGVRTVAGLDRTESREFDVTIYLNGVPLF